MNKKLLLAISLFTVFVCCIFVAYNPTIAEDNTSNFSDGEMFTHQMGSSISKILP